MLHVLCLLTVVGRSSLVVSAFTCSVRRPRFESHCERLFLLQWPVLYAALGTGCTLTAVPGSTEPCIPLGSLNQVTASAGVREGKSPLWVAGNTL